MMPDFDHIFPVDDDTIFDWVFDIQNSLFLLGLIPDVGLFLIHSHHDGRHFGFAYHRGILNPRSIFTWQACLHIPWSIIYHHCLLYWHKVTIFIIWQFIFKYHQFTHIPSLVPWLLRPWWLVPFWGVLLLLLRLLHVLTRLGFQVAGYLQLRSVTELTYPWNVHRWYW